MVQYSRLFAAIAAAVGAVSPGNDGGVSAVIISPTETTLAISPPTLTGNITQDLTVENACVLANFQTATADFIALDNLVNILKATPSLLKQYVGDPLCIKNYKMATLNMSFLGHTFEATPTIHSLNVTGITTIAPMPVNVTSSNTLNLGTSFTGTIEIIGSLTVRVAQLHYKWYQLCWIRLLRPFKCKPRNFTMAVALTVRKPQIMTHMRADLYECAPGIPTSVCHNLTMTKIVTDAMSGNLTAVSAAIYKNFKDVRINTLAMDWDMITNVSLIFVNSRSITDNLAKFSIDTLNVKGYYRRVFLDVAQMFLLSLMNKIIDSTFKPLFGATCL